MHLSARTTPTQLPRAVGLEIVSGVNAEGQLLFPSQLWPPKLPAGWWGEPEAGQFHLLVSFSLSPGVVSFTGELSVSVSRWPVSPVC